ncbi:hypothetical protein EVJ58_g8568 [Rhodofomes roseus]|uniref:RING-type domain-containing protein n=1 Tax=Rhodofomes roseus TaxID=34475 RepID=A0A4Y9XXW1_9APHY|nr:hypothetical protein EVJ58_g8568 [Rhodofomes roseus]
MQTRIMADRRPSGVSSRSARPLRSLPKTKSGAGSRSSQKSSPARKQEDPAVTEPEAEDPNPRAPKQRKVETPRKPGRIVAMQETAAADTSVTRSRRAPRQSDAVEVADGGDGSPAPEPINPDDGASDWQIFEDELRSSNIQFDKREKALQKKLGKLAKETEAVRDREQDVLANPYSLSPADCGHVYCSLCILQWFFTNLCDRCKGWCKILECPLCRTALPQIPSAIPRPIHSLPFTPAHAADERITEVIDTLRGPVPAGPSKPSGIRVGKGFVFIITDSNVPYIAVFCTRIALIKTLWQPRTKGDAQYGGPLAETECD